MTEPNLLAISAIAFLAVFVLLSLLAVIMHGLTLMFPDKVDDPDAALLAAIISAAAAAYPDKRVTHLDQIR
ncbi:hypothetical protein BH23GEM5_BH23GEM5_24310 [soil metagenome]|jgi:hypothetical protein